MKKINENRPGYKKTKVGWIPEEWEVSRFKDCVLEDGVYGLNAAACEYQEHLPKYLRITDIDKYGNYSVSKISSVNHPEMDKYILKKGDMVFARTGSTTGKTYFYNEKDGVLVYAGFLIRFTPNSEKLINNYLKHYTDSNKYLNWVKLMSMRSGQPGINSKEYCSLHLPLPPLPEQKKISAILFTWDIAIEKLESLIEAKEKLKKGLMQQLLSGKCDDWEHIKTKKIFDFISDKNNPNEELLSVTQDRGVIPRNMLSGKVMSPQGSTASYKLIVKGDFVISLRSFQGGIEYSNYQGIISPAYTVLRPKIKLDDDFFRYFFKTYLFINKYLNIAVIGIRDGKQINIPDFMTVKIPVPELEEQKYISSIFKLIDKEINLHKHELEKYKEQKKGLMQVLLTGKIRVRT